MFRDARTKTSVNALMTSAPSRLDDYDLVTSLSADGDGGRAPDHEVTFGTAIGIVSEERSISIEVRGDGS